ncbi:glycoside hydrolase family 13 protein [Streptomyces sioyaensis]|uniref:Glycoside hydrolase family 13 protein n=1 Tax=Streptomyces sioyaensis TaxID=67364 RepID=A0A4Q1QZX6_9ACTN|nr:glycoside hydrolase family 13 protein [Streptomyces sioyaensis]MBM4796518.1 glycoside hydrolase family 13 protein [Streptomyces sioyaensis]RXS62750.1 glycoside hydrolase family 13 protein [Streptomyces sioyaensis]
MTPQHNVTPENATPDNVARATDWWRDAVIYQVYPRSFADGNGDGMGDLAGIRGRLPYLRDLGVDAVWLSPFYASPQADAGYDVADYRAIDPMFGTLADAEAVIRDAHAHGLRIIVDLVPNHCSDQHVWFRRARADGPGSTIRERFHFRKGRGENGELPPNDWESLFGGPAWTRVADGEWYLHLFAPEQPDFNWDHPAVRDEFRSVLRFWLDLGVDGFRVDVAHGLVKAPGLPDMGHGEQLKLLGNQVLPFFDQDGVHEIYRSWRTVLDEYAGERIAVAEAWTPTVERTARYLRPDELHQAFNFHYLNTDWDATALREAIDTSLDAMRPVSAPTTWVLSNHDVVRHTTRLGGGLDRARAATLLMLALPGSAYLYQGEELGLPEVTDLPDEVRQDPSFFRAAGQEGLRDGCRVPLPWSGDAAPYGFGTGGSWLPQPADWATLTVEAQTGDPDSTLELYRTALSLRRTHPALGAGESVEWLDAPDGVLAFRRPGGLVCTVNTTQAPVRLADPGARILLSSRQQKLSDGDFALLPADTTVWWQE